ncbi:MAG: SpoIIE family protein phosphatase [Bdellovibrionales bacterium]
MKTKFLVILVGLAIFILLSFAALALRDFEKDKIAYVFDSLLSNSKSTSVQVRTDIDYAVDKAKFYMRGFDARKIKLHPYSQAIFQSDDLLTFLAIYDYDPSQGLFIEKQSLFKTKDVPETFGEDAQKLAHRSLRSEISLDIYTKMNSQWAFAIKYENKLQPDRPIVLVMGLTQGNFVENILRSSLQDSYLIDESGSIIAQPSNPLYLVTGDNLPSLLDNITTLISTHQGVTEVTSPDQKEWLASKSNVGIGRLQVVSLVAKDTALETLVFLRYKAALFLVFLVCFIVIVSLIAAGKLTANLRKLTAATKKISEGIFDINIKIKSKDEMGQLAGNFNEMAKEIQRLLEETAEKSRMENELKTAKLVQKTLFPTSEFKNENIEISGFYEPASECGGDWWYHSHKDGKSFLWIGDATGHGAPAALVTAAARSASIIIEKLPGISAAEIASVLNSAVYGTAKSEVLMTFFIGIYHADQRRLEYVNASHDPPLLLPKKANLDKADIITLNEKIGPRLGQSPDTVYESCFVDIKIGDQILFYTDGVTELKNPENMMFGERKLLKGLVGHFNAYPDDINSIRESINADLAEFREGHPLEDDVTFFMTRFH